MIRLWVLGVLAFLFFGGIKTVGAEEEIKIGYLPLVMSLPTFVAAERGFFKEEGLKVEPVPFQSGTAIIDALVAGRIQADCGSAISGHWFMVHPVSVLNFERGYPGGAFSIGNKFLKDHPEEAGKIRRAIEKGVDFIRENEMAARADLEKYTRLPKPVAMKVPFDKWTKIKELDKTAGEDYFRVLYKEGVYKKEMDTTILYWE